MLLSKIEQTMTVIPLIYKSRGLFCLQSSSYRYVQKIHGHGLDTSARRNVIAQIYMQHISISIMRDGANIWTSVDENTFGVTTSFGHSLYEEKDYSCSAAYIIAYS